MIACFDTLGRQATVCGIETITSTDEPTAALTITRATVVWVYAAPPRCVGAPRSVSARRIAAWPVTPSARSLSTSSARRCARSAAMRPAWGAAAVLGPPPTANTPVAGQRRPARLGGPQCGPRPLAEQLALLLRHGGVDPHRPFVGSWHVGGAGRAHRKRRLATVHFAIIAAAVGCGCGPSTCREENK